MPLRGGASDKVGNRYERLWTVFAFLDVLAGEAEYVQVEYPGDDGSGARFLLLRDGTREWHQVRRQRVRYQWTIRNLSSARVLESWWPKIQDGDRCVFVSGTSAQELHELAERAAQAESWAEFNRELPGARHHCEHFDQLRGAWGNCSGEAAFLALRQVNVHVIGEGRLRARVLDRAASLVDGDPAQVARLLADMADYSIHQRVSASDIQRILDRPGRPPFRYKAGRDRHAGTQRGFRDAVDASGGHGVVVGTGNVQYNDYLLQVGRRLPNGHGMKLLAGLAAALAAVVAAAYLWLPSSAVPEYFQTGPGAGIYVPASTSKKCGGVTPGALISPATDLFSDVSEIRALSVGGRSAFLMQGDFGGTAYDWVVSDPDGNYGGMQLRWWARGGKISYCTVSITDAPPAALAQQGIRQIASMAVPTVVNGKSLSFQACVWYTVRKGVIPSTCWPP